MPCILSCQDASNVEGHLSNVVAAPLHEPSTMKTRKTLTTRVTVPTFLALPTEIRYEIYRLLLTVPLLRLQEHTIGFPTIIALPLRFPGQASREAKTQPRPVDGSAECSTQVLRLCHQIYDEAFPFFYSHVTIAIEKPFDFANGFLFRLDSPKISQLRNLIFRTAELGNRDQLMGANHSRAPGYKHIVTVFKSYPELKNLDIFVMETVDRIWSPMNVGFSEEIDVESSSITSEINPAPYGINTRLWRAGVMLAKGSLKNFTMSRIFKRIILISDSSNTGHGGNRTFMRLEEVELVNGLIFRNNSRC